MSSAITDLKASNLGKPSTGLKDKPLTKEAAKFFHEQATRSTSRTPTASSAVVSTPEHRLYSKWRKVELYRKFMGGKIKINKKITEESPEALLDVELKSYQDQLSLPAALIGCKETVLFVMEQIENTTTNVWNPMNLDLRNLSQISRTLVEKGEVFQTEIPELAIWYNDWFCQGPLVRTCVQMFYLVKLVDTLNKQGISFERTREKVSQEMHQEYQDL